MKGKAIDVPVAMRPGKRRALLNTTEGRLDDLIESAMAHIRAKGEHPLRLIKPHFGFQKTRFRGMLRNGCNVNVLAALANLFMARHLLLCETWIWRTYSYLGEHCQALDKMLTTKWQELAVRCATRPKTVRHRR